MIKMARVPIVSMLLLTCFVLRCHSLICPPSCSCRGTSVLNCSLAGLWTMPKIPDSVAHLDISHNGLERVALLRRTLPRLRSLSLANNSIARLSLCIHGRVQGRGCASWAPNLHLLSVERNQLRRLPRGLSTLETLEILCLSFNSITTIHLGELDNLRGLRELHLQHNLISSLHSDAFRHLQQLKILNVSFNMLTSLNPSIYLSLHTIGADVHLAGNRWRCDCNMRSIRRWMALDRSRGSHSLDLVCASPPILAGADVLEVEDDDLNCWSAEKEPKLHQDMTVHRDSQVLLSCATKGGLWRTPAGLVPANQPQSGLLVSAITEKNTGLYVCLSEDYQVVSVFHLHIAGTSRKARSVTERITGGERSQTVTQSDLTLAVCLSVFITFLVAFILGVLLRPYIDMLWKRITRKKTSNPVSSAEERQYDNEAYSAGEDPEELRPHRERRVTFSTVDFREENDVKYHNKERETKANGTVVECEMDTDGDSGSERSLERRDSEDTRGLSDQNLKRKGSLSDSSLSDKDQKQVDTVQQNSTELPPISINKTPGFAFEPILHPNNGRILAEEPEDDEEQFEFSDRSTSPRTSSPVGSYNYSRQIMPRLNRKDSSNSSSYMSDDEPSEYTVNPDLQEEEDMRRRYAKSGHEPSLDQDTELWWPAVDLEHSMRVQRRLDIKVCEDDRQTTSFSKKPGTEMVVAAGVAPSIYLSSSDSEETRRPVTVPLRLDSQTQRPALDLEHTIAVQRYSDIKAPLRRSDSLSGTDSEDGSIHLTEAPQRFDRAGLLEQEVGLGKDTRWPAINLQQIPRIERHLNVKSTLPDSFSSSDSEDVRRTTMLQPPSKVSPSYDAQATRPSVDLEDSFRIKRRLDVQATSPTLDASSDSDSDEVVSNYITKPEQETRNVTRYPIKAPPTPNYDPQSPWPSIDLEDSFRIKRRLNVKVLSPRSYSSSSRKRDYGTTRDITKQEQELAKVTKSSTKASSTPSYYPHGRWPKIDLEDSFRIKRRLNVKGPPSPSDSFSSSNSEHETTQHITKHEQRPTPGTRYSLKESPTPNYDPHAPWPTLNLADSFQIKRRLDVKARSTTLDASSDSDEVVTNYIIKPEQETRKLTRYPIKAPPTPNYDTQSPWPSIDLEDSFRIKRRLNVKVLSPRSYPSSSRNRDYGTTRDVTKQEQGIAKVTRSATKSSLTPSDYPHGRWPTVGLEDSFRIKRRLDVKGPPTHSDSSPSSDSEHEAIQHITKHEQRPTQVTRYSSKESATPNYDPHAPWPTLNLKDSFGIKRRLDVKARSSTLDASSDSDDIMTNYITKPEQETRKVTRYPMKAPPTPNHDTQSPWPSIDLEDSFRIKRRLNVKVLSPPSYSSSSRNRDHGTTHDITKQEQGLAKVTRSSTIASSTPSYYPHGRWPTIDLEDSFRIKRRLNVKGPSPPSDSSSSTDSEHETIHHTTKHEQRPTQVNRYSSKGSPKPNYDPHSPWPTLNLADSFRIKRRLDVKATSTTLDASSDSKSDDEVTNYITKPEQDNRKLTRYPIKAPSTIYDPQATWPMVDLDGTFRIKRRLNVKQLLATPDSPSSSNNKNEMTFHPTKQKQGVTNTIRYPMKPSYDPEVPWPSLDFKDSFRIKRRLDFKAPLPTSDLISSSESEDETMYYTQKQGQGKTKITSYVPKAPSYGPQSTWPTLELENSFRIKRRLDINVPSPHSDSLSSSDREYDITHHIIKQNLGTRKTHHPINVSPRISSDSQSSWPSLYLEDSFPIKRRLNFQVLSPTSDLSSITMKQEQGTANLAQYAIAELTKPGHDPQGLWSLLDLEDSFRIKRRLEIKAPSPASTYSSNSEEATFVDGQRQGYYETEKGRSSTEPSNVSHGVNQPTSSNEQDDTNADATETQALPRVYLGVNRRLDIKVSSPQQQLAADRISPEACYSKSNCSTSDSDEENQDEKASLKVADKSSIKSPVIIVPRSPKKDSNIKLEKYVIVPETTGDKLSNATPEINSELQSRWANMHLGFSRFRKRLEITSHAYEPPVVPLSESDPEQTKQKHTVLGWQGNTHTESPLTAAQNHDNTDQPAVGPTSEGKSSVTGLPRIRMYLDVMAPATLKQGLDSSSSSENEADSTEYSQWRAKPHDPRLSSSYATLTVETQQTAEKSQVATVPRQPSSDNSEDDMGEVAEASEMTGVPRSVTPHSDSPIPYRRLIIKPSSLPNDTSTRDQHTDGMTTQHGSSYSTRYQRPSLAPKTIPNPRSGDHMSSTREIYSYSYSARPYTARNQTLYVAPKTIPSLGNGDDTPLTMDSSDVNIRTTQSGSSYSGRYQIPSLAPRPFRNSTEGPPAAIRWTGLRTRLSDPSKHPDSSLPSPLGGLPKTQAGSRTMEVPQENRSTTVTRSLHLGSDSLSFGTDEMWKGASEKTERKGLSALKAMSESRQTWDKDEKVRHFQPSGNSGNSNQNRTEDLVSYTSPSIGEDLPYDILRYRTHALTQEIPPPVPTTPLPDEAVELTRNSKSSYTPSISQV